MTENTDVTVGTTEVTEATEPVTFWRPRDDEAVLCEKCGVKEMNLSLLVQLGIQPPWTSMEDVVAKFAEIEGAGPDYFVKSDKGKCEDCGVER